MKECTYIPVSLTFDIPSSSHSRVDLQLQHNMNALSRSSPAKRKSTQSESRSGVYAALYNRATPTGLAPGPTATDGGHLKFINKRDGKGKFAPCDRTNNRDADSCSVFCTIPTPSTTYHKPCQLCLAPMGGTPSLGIPTDQVNSRGYKGKRKFSL
ncbi:unnamed protein product [Ectocarpus sp. 6 AP-2014]